MIFFSPAFVLSKNEVEKDNETMNLSLSDVEQELRRVVDEKRSVDEYTSDSEVV